MDEALYPIRELQASEFPTLLREIPDCPMVLYVRGTLAPSEHKILTVVGSRDYTPYGRQATETLIRGLSGYPISIVSGLARGVDAIAHQAALDTNLHTVAVLGTGVTDEAIYPRRNLLLARDILHAGGGILGEFKDPIPFASWVFPRRNRIKAGMSHAVLIVEAGEKSGTMITARLGMEYNREVLAIPGNIFSPTSSGTNTLIRDGATPVSNATDIIEALGLSLAKPTTGALFSGTEDEHTLLSLLDEPCQRDTLSNLIGRPSHEVSITLSMLELKGYIKEENGIVIRTISI